MARILQIRLIALPAADLLHRFRNFGEDVYRALGEKCKVSLDEIDACTEVFHVGQVRTREARQVEAVVREMAARHHLADVVKVEQVTTG